MQRRKYVIVGINRWWHRFITNSASYFKGLHTGSITGSLIAGLFFYKRHNHNGLVERSTTAHRDLWKCNLVPSDESLRGRLLRNPLKRIQWYALLYRPVHMIALTPHSHHIMHITCIYELLALTLKHPSSLASTHNNAIRALFWPRTQRIP